MNYTRNKHCSIVISKCPSQFNDLKTVNATSAMPQLIDDHDTLVCCCMTGNGGRSTEVRSNEEANTLSTSMP